MVGGKPSSFLVVPPHVVFTAAEEEACYRHLIDSDEYTVVTTIVTPEDVMLDDTGVRKCDKYRYTYHSLRQLCNATSNGLLPLVMDLSGVRRKKDAYDEVISVATAARVFNACVRVRFLRRGGLYGKQLLSNSKLCTVDGLMSPAFQYMQNSALYEIMEDMRQRADLPLRFHEALVVGRWVGLTYLLPATFNIGGQRFSHGVYVATSEVGECGMHTSTVVACRGTSYKCLGPFTQARHIGKQFTKKVRRIVASTMQQMLEDISGCALELQGRSFDLGQNTIRKRLIRALVQRGVEPGFAARSVDWTAQVGAGEKVKVKQRPKPGTTRSGTELFLRLLIDSRGLSSVRREMVERAAYALLTGGFGG